MVETGMTLKQAILAEAKFAGLAILIGLAMGAVWTAFVLILQPTLVLHPLWTYWSIRRTIYTILALTYMTWTFVRGVKNRMRGSR